jgi:acetyl-CoA acetyltransferase
MHILSEDQIALVGGTESMSQAPFVARGIRWGRRVLEGGQGICVIVERS